MNKNKIKAIRTSDTRFIPNFTLTKGAMSPVMSSQRAELSTNTFPYLINRKEGFSHLLAKSTKDGAIKLPEARTHT